MSQDDNQQRYDDILKRIANRKVFDKSQTTQKPKSAYDLILDSLNAYDKMATLPLQDYKHILCYGPQAIRQSKESGVVIWYRNKGYHGYKTLHLLGIWAHHIETNIALTIGIRNLPYRAVIYNAEGYHASIHKGFRAFYEDDGHHPTDTDNILFQMIYQQKERLTHRQTLHKILHQWQLDINSN
jgi:hypothetical protein